MLEWTEEYDDHDNTIHVAQGLFQDEDGTTFHYRIKPVLQDDSIMFSIQGTDEELTIATDKDVFASLERAKAHCQDIDDNIRAELANM